jgi:membrane associated rhomboid family serine protease
MIVAMAMIAIWLVTIASGAGPSLAADAGLIPARLSGLVDSGAAVPAMLTPITSSFLHFDLVHIALNLLMLGFCGKHVESALGKGLMAFAMLVSAYAAAAAEWLWHPASTGIIIGASGVTSGLVGLYAIIYSAQDVPNIGPLPPYMVRIVWLAVAWIGLQVLVGFAFGGQIAIMAHIGGFVAGLLLARPLLKWRYARTS